LMRLEEAIEIASRAAEDQRQAALDPTLSPDAAAARAAADAATLARDRLLTLRPRLQSRLHEVVGNEALAQWRPGYDSVKARRDALATQLRDVYTAFLTTIVPLLHEIEQFDNEITRINNSKPQHPASPPLLLATELCARGIAGFGLNDLSVLQHLSLPGWEPHAGRLWPPNRVPDFAMITRPPGGDSRLYGPNWWQVHEERAAAAHARAAQAAEEQQRQRDANWHGPRWWEKEERT